MKNLLLIIYCLFPLICLGQTTFFNESPIVSKDKSTRLFSLEICETGVVATIEIIANRNCKRIDYWTSENTSLFADGYKLLSVRGYYINGNIEPCGYNRKWGWSNVKKGESRYYKLFFGGDDIGENLPSGISRISIVDSGVELWIGSQTKVVHSYSFFDYPINNPKSDGTKFISKEIIQQNIDSHNDGICGIYEQIAGGSDYNIACIYEDGQYKLIYLNCKLNFSWWNYGDLKATLIPSASGIFRAKWLMSNKSINRDAYISFDGASMKVSILSGTDPGVWNYLKMYPIQGSFSKDILKWTGSGFAIDDCLIATNNHVVDGARVINVFGIDGNDEESFQAEVIARDIEHDLAILKLKDRNSRSCQVVPFSVDNRQCNVGEDIFVLGYPMSSYLGKEIKLTNGIISSRSGYNNEKSTYQISAPLQPGNSGGPMFDSYGNVVGIVNSGVPSADNVGYAIKSSYLHNLCKQIGLEIVVPSESQKKKCELVQVVPILQKYVYLIQCSK